MTNEKLKDRYPRVARALLVGDVALIVTFFAVAIAAIAGAWIGALT